VTLSGEAPVVILQGFPLLFSATLQILGIVGLHICALKVAGADLLEILPAIDRVSRQVIEPGSGRVSQVDGKELDEKELTVRPTHEAVLLQPNAEIGFAVILDDVVERTEMPREARMPEARGVRSGGPARDGMGPAPMKTRFPPRGALSWSFACWP
jgi:hypothetical protein